MLDRYLKICSIQIVVLDFIGLNAIFYIVRSWLGQTGEPINVDVDTFLIGANIAWMVALYSTGIYFVSQQLSYERVARKTVQGILLYMLLLLGYLFMYKQLNSRSFVILYCSLFILVVLIDRFIFYLVTNYILHSRAIQKKVVILGYNDVSKKLVDSFIDVKSNLQFEGFFEEYSNVHELSYYPVIGNLEDCVPYAKSNNIQEIYSTLS
ncbi:MAG TPA: hypothetical protein VGD35_03115, partial [Chitinophaga sp.]